MGRAARRQERRRRDHALRRERLSGAHRGRGEGLPRRGRRRAAQDAEAHEPLAPLRARRGRAGVPRRGDPADAGDRDALGLRGRRRDDDVRLRRSRRDPRPQRAVGRAPRGPPALRPGRERSDRVLPQPGDRRARAPHAPLRHPRLRDRRAHRVRVGRPGARHRAEADPPRRRRLRARRRLRLDDQPDRDLGLLPPLRAVDRQRHAGAREPSVRRHAQRLPAGRRRGLPRARGMGGGAPARRAHLRRARGRRQLAVVLPDHRLAARRRRPDPGDARGARRRGRGAGGRRLPERARHVDRA